MSKIALNRHPADIKAEVAKRGSNLSRIARAAGLNTSTTSRALRVPCFAGEQAIATFLGVHPKTLWPNRYDRRGNPLHRHQRARFNGTVTMKSSQKTGSV